MRIRDRAKRVPLLLLLGVPFISLTLGLSPGAGLQVSPCPFSGPAPEQAKCLLRPVAPYGHVGAARASLPAPLDRLVGQPTAPTLSRESLRSYLAARGVSESDIGGSLSDPVSRTSDGRSAQYFIIHDTSSPTLERGATFPPAGMDSAEWPGNNLRRYVGVTNPVAHVFINRLGQSATGHDFKKGWRSTRYEQQTTLRRGLFLGVESIQPRRRDARGIDVEAPTPGFTDAQLDRLALVYAAASVRRGEWLTPAYHAVIDLGVGTHDDPQNFDLDRWAARLGALLEAVGSGGGSGGGGQAAAVERLVTKYGARLRGARYMEQNCEPATYAGYDGLPLVKCSYTVRDGGGLRKTATVIMLNPTVEQIARWVVHACLQVKGSAEPLYTDKLFNQILTQSGGQFPVAGIVFEDILPADGVNEIYCFRDGVTIRVDGVPHRGTSQPTGAEITKSLTGEVQSSFVYARLQGTTREQYRANGGTVDVGTSAVGQRKLSWLAVSRDSYKAAWGRDRNELMIAWARANL